MTYDGGNHLLFSTKETWIFVLQTVNNSQEELQSLAFLWDDVWWRKSLAVFNQGNLKLFVLQTIINSQEELKTAKVPLMTAGQRRKVIWCLKALSALTSAKMTMKTFGLKIWSAKGCAFCIWGQRMASCDLLSQKHDNLAEGNPPWEKSLYLVEFPFYPPHRSSLTIPRDFPLYPEGNSLSQSFFWPTLGCSLEPSPGFMNLIFFWSQFCSKAMSGLSSFPSVCIVDCHAYSVHT